ncbi:unnamed protein product [Linum trigynum]|uniref:Ubiquitin-like domain-containing protein n=1 Tax=Linum trigynum TaxID=586398 RepID=A0AAV2G9F1_9ROSI
MMVAVEIMTGSLFHVNVEDKGNARIVDLKRAIAAQQKLPFDRMILLLGDGRCISDDEEDLTLAECGVDDDGSRVYLFFKPIDDGSSRDFIFTWPEAFF